MVDRGFSDFRDFVLDDFFYDAWPSKILCKNTFKIDVQENDNEYLVELPSVNKDEVNIEMNEGRLNISIQEKSINEEKNKKITFIRKERFSSMSRSLYLDDAKSTGIKAKLENRIIKHYCS